MGTRSTVMFVERRGKEEIPLVNIYQQFDGYIDGVGKDLARWLNNLYIVNGISFNEVREIANGVGCLAAQYIARVKDGAGGLYITSMDDRQEYNYKVIIDSYYGLDGVPANDITEIIVALYDDPKPVFKGTPSQLMNFNEG